MPPRIPIELAQARQARDEAWTKYMDAVDLGMAKVFIDELYHVCQIMESHVVAIYKQWQALGGTSDITSIALHKDVDVVDIERWQDEDWQDEDWQDEKNTQNSVRPTLY